MDAPLVPTFRDFLPIFGFSLGIAIPPLGHLRGGFSPIRAFTVANGRFSPHPVRPVFT